MQEIVLPDVSFDLIGGRGFSVDTDKRDAVVAAFKVSTSNLAVQLGSFAKNGTSISMHGQHTVSHELLSYNPIRRPYVYFRRE